MSEKSRIEDWIDNHRELILILFILPIGKFLSLNQKLWSRVFKPNPSHHFRRIKRVQKDVSAFAKQRKESPSKTKMLRTNRKGAKSLTTRISDKSDASLIKMNDMRSIVSVDTKKKIIRVEPFVTIGEVVSVLDEKGWQLETAIEMKDATMGGLVLAIGMTTHSHISGLMHDIVEAYEIISAEGDYIRAERHGQNPDLFRALPWSHGTLGLLVAMELRIVPAPQYVRLKYRPFYDLDEFCKEQRRLLTAPDTPYYLEAQVFGKDRAVIIEGYQGVPGDDAHYPVNDISSWYKPFFFKHVESMLSLGEGGSFSELVPNASFLMRHERSMCMTMGQILPTANKPWFRMLFGWTMPPHMPLLKKSRPQEERERSMKQQVYQDFAFPEEHFKDILEHLHDEFEIYPLLVYPCKVMDRGGIVRLPGEHGKEWDRKTKAAYYLNLGIYGTPKKIREGDLSYPALVKVREVEAKIRDWGGFLHTYVDVFSTREEFEQMFDHSLWKDMREKLGAEAVFPSIYDKIKPELDPLQFLDKTK